MSSLRPTVAVDRLKTADVSREESGPVRLASDSTASRFSLSFLEGIRAFCSLSTSERPVLQQSVWRRLSKTIPVGSFQQTCACRPPLPLFLRLSWGPTSARTRPLSRNLRWRFQSLRPRRLCRLHFSFLQANSPESRSRSAGVCPRRPPRKFRIAACTLSRPAMTALSTQLPAPSTVVLELLHASPRSVSQRPFLPCPKLLSRRMLLGMLLETTLDSRLASCPTSPGKMSLPPSLRRCRRAAAPTTRTYTATGKRGNSTSPPRCLKLPKRTVLRRCCQDAPGVQEAARLLLKCSEPTTCSTCEKRESTAF
ncbi:hypothetical protein TGPRC2_263590 [Toxoplasma gondii TgCatPRC2]|uniref:Uncharacterized protein n=4 Tax=Toxoplasma gondii TaxID=5811 RepID=A0A151HN68_TOXGO|nr:hypothetical protein TGME49_263590 [Toxoplasma gondii ME49]EPT29758.1 hypothetical protein TGME49_263590 [Toxoplasma gondii ME49]KYF40806.1 hypothetical protein TGARI_263590 [Toxoplasma gondii ARI]KYK70720.1 hypothetical protein TGPRC2_263590 [Toxoplasma gondii TgCatPRC2]PIM05581.1 hypothetical protein TGCOUG_263590 [Toxoplasma gondii COUG]|eukprot:XP_018637168.1 hypothetical protein TGME49_263590 [Toxoplasma gondii ME49]